MFRIVFPYTQSIFPNLPLEEKIDLKQSGFFRVRIYFIFLQGKNYRIIKKRSTFASQSPGILMMDDQKIAVNVYGVGGTGAGDQPLKNPTTQTPTNPIAIPNAKYNNDLTQSKMTSYSEFASWNHLDNECPYW